MFRCRFNGTSNLPLWRIGENVYSSSHLPTGFQYSGEGLYLPKVSESLNNTRFTCLFIVHGGGGNLTRIESSPAYLVVYSSPQNQKLVAHSPTVNIAWTNTFNAATSSKVGKVLFLQLFNSTSLLLLTNPSIYYNYHNSNSNYSYSNELEMSFVF